MNYAKGLLKNISRMNALLLTINDLQVMRITTITRRNSKNAMICSRSGRRARPRRKTSMNWRSAASSRDAT
jgi:hypothetical protein